MVSVAQILIFFVFFNDTATTEIYTLSLHDALPISGCKVNVFAHLFDRLIMTQYPDRKSTRLNSSHLVISYAVFCLKKTNNILLVKPRRSSVVLSYFKRDTTQRS